MVTSRRIFVAVVTFCFMASSGHAAGEKKTKKCPKPKHFAYELDYDWVMGHDKWYFPMMSKQDLLRQSSDILGQPLDKITHEFDQAQDLSFHKKACIQAIWEGLSPIIMGHGGKRTTYTLSPTDWTNFNILGYEKSWFGGQAGTLYITHTDNKNFVFLVRCWEDEARSWSVMTTSKNLSDKVKKEIMDHMKLLKLPEDDIQYLNYDSCPATTRTEL